MSETTPAWHETHSVTCAICGDLADERETQRVTHDIEELGPELAVENPELWLKVLHVVDTYGEGEVHQGCLDEIIVSVDDYSPKA